MNTIEPANINTDKFVNTTSRYKNSTVVYYNTPYKKVLTFNTYKKQVSNIPTEDDTFTVVSPGMEYRPDLLSYQFYGTPDFWWKILEANNIKDIFDFKTGINIRLPSNIF